MTRDKMAVVFVFGLLSGVVITPFVFSYLGQHPTRGEEHTANESSTLVSDLPDEKYGKRGIWRFTANGTTCYYAQTYSGSGYSIDIECVNQSTP